MESILSKVKSNHDNWNKRYSWISMMCTSFFAVSGGSYGSEVVLPVIGIQNFTFIQIIICVFYAIPSILIYDLLYKSFPCNAGPKNWCEGVIGSFSASMIDLLYIFMEIGMLSSYIGVASAYIHSFFRSMKYGSLSPNSQLMISIIIFMIIITISLIMIYFDDYMKWLFFIVVVPLILIIVFTFYFIPLNSWKTISYKPNSNDLDWIIGLQYVMWLNCGYERFFSNNTYTEKESVHNNKLKLSLIFNAIFISFMYILPLWCGCCILNYYGKDNISFQLGNFFTLSGYLVGGNFLSSLITISACFSTIGCITSDVGVVSQFVISQWCSRNNIENYKTSFSQEVLVSLGVIMVCSFLTLIIDQQHFAAGASTLYGFIILMTIIVFLKFLWSLDVQENYSISKSLIIDDNCRIKNLSSPSPQIFIKSLYFTSMSLKYKQIFHTFLAIPTIVFVSLIFFTTSSILYLFIILIAFGLTPLISNKKDLSELDNKKLNILGQCKNNVLI